MTASETGREIPADELATGLRSDAASINSLRRKTPRDVEDAVRYTAAADLIEAQAARISSLEAERARTVEDTFYAAQFAHLNALVHRIRWIDLGIPAMDSLQTQQALTELSQYLLSDALDEALARALASEKGGQADA